MSSSVRTPTAEAVEERAGTRPTALPARTTAAALAVLLCGSLLLAAGLGLASVPVGDTARYVWAGLTSGTIGADEVTAYQIVWQIRLPRVLLAAVVGAGLSVVGVVGQALVRNALADPYVLGSASRPPESRRRRWFSLSCAAEASRTCTGSNPR